MKFGQATSLVGKLNLSHGYLEVVGDDDPEIFEEDWEVPSPGLVCGAYMYCLSNTITCVTFNSFPAAAKHIDPLRPNAKSWEYRNENSITTSKVVKCMKISLAFPPVK